MNTPKIGRFRLPPHVHTRRFESEAIVLDLGGGKYYSLDEVGAIVWEGLAAGKSATDVAATLVSEYEVDASTARDDVERLAGELVAAGLLERQ